jgi:cell wall-associated NlpC family hydrolase
MMNDTEQFIALALAQRGKPYVWGAEGPDSFDCSGLVMWCAAHFGIPLPHYSASQYAYLKDLGLALAVEDASQTLGALLYRGTRAEEHVAISLGNGHTVEAMSSALGIRIGNISGRRWHHAAKLPAPRENTTEDIDMKPDDRVDLPQDGQKITFFQSVRGAYLNTIHVLQTLAQLQASITELRKTVAAIEARTK